VLIFVSLAERYARIVADVGVAEKIGDDEWQGALELLLGEMREGHIAEGYVAPIEETARLLARHIPPEEKTNCLIAFTSCDGPSIRAAGKFKPLFTMKLVDCSLAAAEQIRRRTRRVFRQQRPCNQTFVSFAFFKERRVLRTATFFISALLASSFLTPAHARLQVDS